MNLNQNFNHNDYATYFPLTQNCLGKRAFARIIRSYLNPDANVDPAPWSFPAFLSLSNVAPEIVETSEFELKMAECSDGLPGDPLQLIQLADFPDPELLSLTVAKHPAARIVRLSDNESRYIRGAFPNLENSAFALITRRISGALVLSASEPEIILLNYLDGRPTTIGELLAKLDDDHGGGFALNAFCEAVDHGAIIASE